MRLHGPWEYQPLSRWAKAAGGAWVETTSDLPPPGRMHVPNDWGAALGQDYRGRVRFLRRFNRPTGLERRERVWLVIEGVDACGTVALNGRPIGRVDGYALEASFDITEHLEARNQLEVVAETPPEPEPAGSSQQQACLRPGREHQPGGLIRQIRLEVRHEVYVDRLTVYATACDGSPTLRVSAVAAGPEMGGLNLHVTGMRRELAFAPLRPGQVLHLTMAVPALPRWTPYQPCGLESVEVRLLLRGEAIWEATYALAFREVTWDADGQTLHVNGQATPDVRRLDQIPTEQELGDYDAAGVPVLFVPPSGWTQRLWPKLAHHPSIMAWATQGESHPAFAPGGPHGESGL
jgi:beta-galactosidase/beta-glucuronidase